MKTDTEADALGDALQQLETDLETPVVPGELSTWILTLRKSHDAVGPLLHDVVRDSHGDRLHEIAEQDPELMSKVQQLQQEDQELLREYSLVARKISDLESQDADRVANQPDADDQIAELKKLGLGFVIRVRTQEATLSTWHSEAFQRDRGRAD